AIHAREHSVLELHRSLPRRRSTFSRLLRLAPEFFSIPLARERLLCSALVTRLQIEGMLLDVLDDVFLLHFPLEPTKGALDRFALLDFDFSHAPDTLLNHRTN